MIPPISVEKFRARFNYDPATGLFTKKETGEIWGYPHSSGYVMTANPGASLLIPGSRKPQYAHMLAWWYMTGDWPDRTVDHRDRVRDNNRWDNLRLATMPEQVRNVGKRKNAATFTGVTANRKRWAARICVNMKRIHLGTFDTPEGASAAYQEAYAKAAGRFAPTSAPL